VSSRIVTKTYGTVSPEKQKEMTGLQFVQSLGDGTLPLNTIAKTLGYDIAEAESGRVVVTAERKDIHLNPAGTVHGGLAATMLDICMGLAIQSTLEKGVGPTTLEFKISFVRPITPETGPIKAEGTVISQERRVGTAEGRVTDNKGRLRRRLRLPYCRSVRRKSWRTAALRLKASSINEFKGERQALFSTWPRNPVERNRHRSRWG
jgi:uncharacterized protein (TIGR00369 family)